MRKVIVPNSFFEEVAEALKKGKAVKIQADGQSMYPFIHGGIDWVELVPYDSSEELPLWCCPFYKWGGNYMIHRYVGKRANLCQIMGDGNICRVEEVRQDEVIGILRYIYHPDGTVQDCTARGWLRKGKWWYRVRAIRRFLIPLLRLLAI